MTIEQLHAKFYETKLKDFREKSSRLIKIKDIIYDCKKKEEILEAIQSREANNQMNAIDLLCNQANDEEQKSKSRKTIKNVSDFLYENIDAKQGVVNVRNDLKRILYYLLF